MDFWHSVSSTIGTKHKISEWVKLASIALVQVPGSVEEEPLFSKPGYIKDECSNSLDKGHLNACLMLATQCMWGLHTFPYSRAMGKWAAAKERRLTVQSKHQWQRRQEQPAVIDLDSDADLDSDSN